MFLSSTMINPRGSRGDQDWLAEYIHCTSTSFINVLLVASLNTCFLFETLYDCGCVCTPLGYPNMFYCDKDLWFWPLRKYLYSVFYTSHRNSFLERGARVGWLFVYHICQCKNSLSPSWENLVGAERTTKGALLAYRSSGCVGSPRTSKISKHQLTVIVAFT